MKKAIMVVIVLLMLTPMVSANVYVAYDRNTQDVYSMSIKDDFRGVDVDGEYLQVNDVDYIILPGRLTDYPLQYHPVFYKYQSDRFVVNIKKLSDLALAQTETAERAAEMLLIEKKSKLFAKKELEKEGIIFDKVKDSDFE